MRLLLASASPRRRELLSAAGMEFDIHPSHVDESFDPTVGPDENARLVAIRKTAEIAARFPERPTLGADTVVVFDKKIICKPVDEADAVTMLLSLSGQEHIVYTGVALIHSSQNIKWSHVEKSNVIFKQIDEKKIREYVATGEPMDKAGAYAIQGGAKEWIERFEGSLTNIIGLPMEALTQAFEKLGYNFSSRGNGQ